ncbi:hypothetical protein BC938DRAFT_483125 [Jimgerdemannia flammicorona]|uniref:Uncharacterized protein n=1 Tax=Jimgerdemannia flammicorona TaxID=994334 RepID=A0A433QCI8_9FUNG|nr:hypothetical protein BC938DRAFT_483125 [Jimgerdemannia flammicorona]
MIVELKDKNNFDGGSSYWHTDCTDSTDSSSAAKLSRHVLHIFLPQELTKTPHLFCHNGASLDNNVIQGAVGNCWLVSALGVLQTHPKLLDRVIPKWPQQEWTYRMSLARCDYHPGIFRFRFYRFGHWIEVVIDSFLPVFAQPPENGATPLVYAHSQNQNEFWCALLEKAYAKLCGGYESLESGSASDALVDLTGTVPEQINLHELKTRRELNLDNPGSFFATMRAGLLKEALMSCSISGEDIGALPDQRLENGLIVGHAYGITDLRRIRAAWWRRIFKKYTDTLLIRLHNPWGEGEWNGPWADDSKEWAIVPKSRKKELGVKFADDGDFWMSFSDFCDNFTSLIVCRELPTNNHRLRLFQRHRWRSAVFLARWSLAEKTAGGCVNFPQSFPYNHQYAFTLSEPAVCVISLMQQDSRRDRHLGAENATVGFVVLRVERNRKYRFRKSMYEVIGKVTYMNSREVSGRFNFPPGRYVCVPTTFEAEEEGDFFLRMFFSCRQSVHVEELRKDGPTPPWWWRIPRSIFLQDAERQTLYFYHGFVKVTIVSAELNVPRGKTVVTVPVSTSMSTSFSPDKVGIGASPTQTTVPVFVKDFDCYALLIFMDLQTKRWVRHFETPVCSDTLNPMFNTDFLHYVRNPQRIGVVVQLWERRPLGQDRFMGEIRIALDKYADERKREKTWEVQRSLTKLRAYPTPNPNPPNTEIPTTTWKGWETLNYSTRTVDTAATLPFSNRNPSHDSSESHQSSMTRSAPPMRRRMPMLDQSIRAGPGAVDVGDSRRSLTRSVPPMPQRPVLVVDNSAEQLVTRVDVNVTRPDSRRGTAPWQRPFALADNSVQIDGVVGLVSRVNAGEGFTRSHFTRTRDNLSPSVGLRPPTVTGPFAAPGLSTALDLSADSIVQVTSPDPQAESAVEVITRSSNIPHPARLQMPREALTIETAVAPVTRSRYGGERRIQPESMRSRASRASSRVSAGLDNSQGSPMDRLDSRISSHERRGSNSTRRSQTQRREIGAGEMKVRITYVRDRGQGLMDE